MESQKATSCRIRPFPKVFAVIAVSTVKPFKHASGRWAVQYSAKLSPSGKRQMVYFASESAAKADIQKRTDEQEELGRQLVTAQKRALLAVLASLSSLSEDFPSIADTVPDPVDL
jgi:hypothetical protein